MASILSIERSTFTRRMFFPLLPRRAMVLMDLRFRSNSNVANVCNLYHKGNTCQHVID